jgi:hypothetical protein
VSNLGVNIVQDCLKSEPELLEKIAQLKRQHEVSTKELRALVHAKGIESNLNLKVAEKLSAELQEQDTQKMEIEKLISNKRLMNSLLDAQEKLDAVPHLYGSSCNLGKLLPLLSECINDGHIATDSPLLWFIEYCARCVHIVLSSSKSARCFILLLSS